MTLSASASIELNRNLGRATECLSRTLELHMRAATKLAAYYAHLFGHAGREFKFI